MSVMADDLTRAQDVKLGADLVARTQAAAAVAKEHAATVDSAKRFPAEAFAELKKQKLLGIQVPKTLGGEGASLAQIVDVCYTLGQACASTGLIYAMHHIKMACIVNHLKGNAALEKIVRRCVTDQLLLGSSTTEGDAGGNIRASEAPIGHDGNFVTLERNASVVSYGNDCDAIVTTARRSADAATSNQVLLVLMKSDYKLEKTQNWDTLGMRGTDSEGFTLRARAPQEQMLEEPYERIHAQTMVPFAHLTWGSVWMGIAAAATAKAQSFIRAAMRKSNGVAPPAAAHYTTAVTQLRTLKAVLASSLRSFEAVRGDEKAVTSLEFQSMITLTKVQASELAASTVMSAMRACGLSGYRNDSEFSVARHLRDVLSAPIMINNDRVLTNVAPTMLMTGIPTSICG